ncbi:MAG: S-adenosylmethionine:tRNA ribosyltransferase-isomerase [Flavisolibacter sp.]
MEIEAEKILIKNYDYPLPHDRIPEFPLQQRDGSKLLVYEGGFIKDSSFYHLETHVPAGSTLVLNNTRVIEARVLFKKVSGGVIEIFCLEPHGQTIEGALGSYAQVQWHCLIGGASKWKHGQVLHKEILIQGEPARLEARYITKLSDSFIIEFDWNSEHSFAEILHAAGAIPLPPYIKREAVEEDKERYQTIFGKQEGSVAAPTAALHFTDTVFEKLAQKKIATEYITLHVGAGTFKPVKSETLAGHEMHKEPFTVTIDVLKRMLASARIIAVGTTSMRTIESIYWLGVKLINGLIKDEWCIQQWEVYQLRKNYPTIPVEESLGAIIYWMEERELRELHCDTSMIIVPGYEFKIPVGLITNFHQPQSTLLLLVSAFIGEDWRRVYQHALDNGYRFLSYGDSSLLWRSGL